MPSSDSALGQITAFPSKKPMLLIAGHSWLNYFSLRCCLYGWLRWIVA
jgi:hypothetical protein